MAKVRSTCEKLSIHSVCFLSSLSLPRRYVSLVKDSRGSILAKAIKYAARGCQGTLINSKKPTLVRRVYLEGCHRLPACTRGKMLSLSLSRYREDYPLAGREQRYSLGYDQSERWLGSLRTCAGRRDHAPDLSNFIFVRAFYLLIFYLPRHIHLGQHTERASSLYGKEGDSVALPRAYRKGSDWPLLPRFSPFDKANVIIASHGSTWLARARAI